MPRPRFTKLPAAQQAAILDAAVAEFAAHGYRNASLNRIIEAAGISKGSMYYYFDGKEDLYAHVLREQVGALVHRSGPFPVPGAQHPDEFWATLEDYYLRLLRMLHAAPGTASLLRDWLADPAAPALRGAQLEAEAALLPWLHRTIAAGQAAGAVRDDLADDLIVAVVMGLGQAIDTWLITRPRDEEVQPHAVHALFDLLRRALAP